MPRPRTPKLGRWRRAVGGCVLLALLPACRDAEVSLRPVARVGGLTLDAAVVEHIAARDGLSPDEAHERALDVLRLVAAGRQARAAAGDDDVPVLDPRRAEHLRRAALARLWLEERFEPAHGPEQIPEDDPHLQRARTDPRLVHPELHRVCQVVVQPPDVEDLERKEAITTDPQWRQAAQAVMEPLRERIERTVPMGDPESCPLIQRQIQMTAEPDDPRLEVSFPKAGGFDLDSCLQVAESDGRCIQPRFAPEWTDKVRALSPASLSAPFFTRFGLHLVYLQERLPARPAGAPKTEAALREAVLSAWRADQLDQRLDAMGKARSVRLVSPSAWPSESEP